ncbi:hypothetical protein NDA11_006261 [Ustilago hordei]|nr:hypothetical protein NDA11_006261 [Ustilago hordei]KAJ1597142.1 hypothetical protein NDA14_007151 [Ustilago hordei]
MRNLPALLLLLSLALALARTQGTNPPLGPSIPPPAGRALLSRGADLEPYDFPPIPLTPLSATNPRRPPFEVWFKEQQLIRAINTLSHAIDLDLHRPYVTLEDLLEHEMQFAELNILLRMTQIATAIRYANVNDEWRKWEEDMLRHWAGFLEVGKGMKADGENERWQRHLEWIKQLEKKRNEESRKEEEFEQQLVREQGKGKLVMEGTGEGDHRWNEIPLERGSLQSSTPKRWKEIQIGKDDLQGSTSRRGSDVHFGEGTRHDAVRKLMEKAEKGEEKMLEGINEAVARGLHF